MSHGIIQAIQDDIIADLSHDERKSYEQEIARYLTSEDIPAGCELCETCGYIYTINTHKC